LIRYANAPVSWGAIGIENEQYLYTAGEVLDGIAAAGYTGSELGPHGFYPTVPTVLRRALDQRGLSLASAFFWTDLANRATLARSIEEVRRTAALISSAGARLLVLADRMTSARCAIAGRVAADGRDSWTSAEWTAVAETVGRIVAECSLFGLRVAFHHHTGTHVERPEELDRLLSLFAADELGVCLDTGHYLYGGGDPVSAARRYGQRVWHVHLKDVNADVLTAALVDKIEYNAAVRAGVFVPIGEGTVGFAGVFAALSDAAYNGWAVVEQDVMARPDGRLTSDPFANAAASRKAIDRFQEV
jgi:inosose dehydratase